MRALIVYNPFSGRRHFCKMIDVVYDSLIKKYTVDIFKSTGPKSITRCLMMEAMNYDLVVVSGGDGTLNEAINGIMMVNQRPEILYIPSGTVNDVGKMLGLKGFSSRRTLKKIKNLELKEMDVCKIEDRFFVYAAAAGKFTNVSYDASSKVKKKIGRTAYFVESVKQFPINAVMNLDIVGTEEKYCGEYYLTLLLNTQRVAGFSFYRKRNVKLNDGVIDATFIKKRNFSILNMVLFFLLGDRWSNGIETMTTNQLKIKSKDQVSYNVDGEYAFDSKEINVCVIPKAIKIYVGKKAAKRYFI